MKRFLKISFAVLSVIMLLAVLLQFDFIAKPIATAVKKPVESVKSLAKTVLFIGLGLMVVYFGVLALPALTIAGVALILVGGFLLYQAVVPLLMTKKPAGA